MSCLRRWLKEDKCGLNKECNERKEGISGEYGVESYAIILIY